MCDYSLHSVASRPARLADKLVVTKFSGTTTRGFAAIDDRATAVCLCPGTELAFDRGSRILASFSPPKLVRKDASKDSTVYTTVATVHHDAVEFPSGRIVLLTRLCAGQRATVLQLPPGPHNTSPGPRNTSYADDNQPQAVAV
jgi:hypothetical protein